MPFDGVVTESGLLNLRTLREIMRGVPDEAYDPYSFEGCALFFYCDRDAASALDLDCRTEDAFGITTNTHLHLFGHPGYGGPTNKTRLMERLDRVIAQKEK